VRFTFALVLVFGLTPRMVTADDRIAIVAKVNDQPIKLALDTGATATLIFAKTAAQHGIRVDPPPADTKPKAGEVLTSTTEPVKFELFGHVFPGARLSVFDAPSSLPFEMDGIVSWSDIRNNLWTISGGRDLVIALVSELPAGLDSWVRARELPELNILSVELPATGTNAPVRLGFDTGSNHGVALSPEEWKRWRASHSETPLTLEASYMPGAGLFVTEVAWAGEINLSGVLLRQVPVRRMNATEVAVQAPGTIAVVGLFGLRRLNAVLDGKNHATYLRPHAVLDLTYQHNRLGAVFTPDTLDGEALRAHVAPGTPAAKAGIRDGDVLLKIDDLDVTPWRTKPGILPLSRFFIRPAGTHLRLTLQREGRVIGQEVVLSDILDRKN
jgi:hypothetical protein